MDRRQFGRVVVAATAAAAATHPTEAAAVTVGEPAPNARVRDADDHALWLSDLEGQPVVVFYEDKESGEVNRALKDDLARLINDEGVKSLRVLPVADVSAYDSWPAKGFVRKAIREASAKNGLTIYCDWDASFRKKLDLQKATSNVVMMDKKGCVRFTSHGLLSDGQRQGLLNAVRAEAKT